MADQLGQPVAKSDSDVIDKEEQIDLDKPLVDPRQDTAKTQMSQVVKEQAVSSQGTSAAPAAEQKSWVSSLISGFLVSSKPSTQVPPNLNTNSGGKKQKGRSHAKKNKTKKSKTKKSKKTAKKH